MKLLHPTLPLALAALMMTACPDDDVAGSADATADPGVADTAADATGDAAASDATAGDVGPDAPSLALGPEASVTVTGATLELRRRGEILVQLPLDELELGTVPTHDPVLAYDPYFLEDVEQGLYDPPAGLAWHRPTVGDVTVAEGALTVALTYEGGRTATLTVTADDDRRARAVWALPDGEPVVVFARLRPRVAPTEHFYGLGEVFDTPDHRGKVRAMQLEPKSMESSNNERHVPIPLLIGTRGWGLFVDSLRPGVFAVANEQDDLIQITYSLDDAAAEEGLTFALMAEDHPLDITRHYYEMTGFPGAVAPWALGPLIWRDEVDDQAAVEADLQQIRDLDLATTGYWIDRPYASAVNSFDFDDGYPDPAAMVQAAHDAGFRMALWHTPYVDPDDPDSEALHQHAVDNGFFAPEMSTAVANWGPPLDYTNPDAFAWWVQLLQAYKDLGIEGYKLDYAEEVQVGAYGVRLPWRFFDGSDDQTMHRGYQLGYHKAYDETLPEDGGFLLVRAGATGDQVHGVIVWPGDIDANFARYGQEMEAAGGGTYIAVGGIPAAVVAGSSLGPSGFPFFGSDTGGYRRSPPDQETYIRWFEHTALSTCMQVGTNTNDLPWALGKPPELIPQVLDLYREYARLHLRLFPYLWSYWQRVAFDGRAIQRPLGLAHPELGVHPAFDYLLGEHLVVAPVVDRGATTREVTLPEGVWQHWFTGEIVTGSATVAAPLGRLPLFARSWMPIPLLRPTIDTLNPVADPDAIDSTATQAGPLWYRVAANSDFSDWSMGPIGETHDGASLALVPMPGEGCVDVTALALDGTTYTGGAVLELVIAPGDVFAGATWDEPPGAAEPVPEVADVAAFEAADTAWMVAPDAGPVPGAVAPIWLKLPDGPVNTTVTVCAEASTP